ncbi:hypothetical protein [Phenylobacterium aquaticum]|uniref:hypothetical protein n=1 Tax=Phenylobacterium aquaticum TaxID=1763816 RepID=UPI0026E9767B|nr:hypothetical protein [Phenylobacterium aquaticum]
MGVNVLFDLVERSHGAYGRQEGSRVYEFHQLASRLFELSLSLRRKCGYDSDAVFIYMAFVLAAAIEAVNGASQASVISLSEVEASLSAFSISNMTGIPRETVRRKLRLLEQNEVILSGPGASYTIRLDRARLQEVLLPRPGGGLRREGTA